MIINIITYYDMHLNQCNTSSDVIIFFHYSLLWINAIEDGRTNYIIIITSKEKKFVCID